MKVIEASALTKDYGAHKGVFDLSFEIKQGESVGILGPNGSGKTTTIRQLMGFIKPDSGTVKILGMDCFEDAKKIQASIGYLPGELTLMEDMSGMALIEWLASLKRIPSLDRAKQLMDDLALNPHLKIKKMSKGMKQKVGLVIALMQDAPVLILDEPTSGLDPLMQKKFVALMQQAKMEGKTILMSSHLFEEIESVSDRVMMIKDGTLIADEKMEKIKDNHYKHYTMTFLTSEEAAAFQTHFPLAQVEKNQLTLAYPGSPMPLIEKMQHYHIIDLAVRPQSLEELFMHFYGGENNG